MELKPVKKAKVDPIVWRGCRLTHALMMEGRSQHMKDTLFRLWSWSDRAQVSSGFTYKDGTEVMMLAKQMPKPEHVGPIDYNNPDMPYEVQVTASVSDCNVNPTWRMTSRDMFICNLPDAFIIQKMSAIESGKEVRISDFIDAFFAKDFRIASIRRIAAPRTDAIALIFDQEGPHQKLKRPFWVPY